MLITMIICGHFYSIWIIPTAHHTAEINTKASQFSACTSKYTRPFLTIKSMLQVKKALESSFVPFNLRKAIIKCTLELRKSKQQNYDYMKYNI